MRGIGNKKPIKSVPVSLQEIRHQLVERLWSGLFIVAIVGAPASALRSISTGWLNLYTIHLVLAVLVISAYLFKEKISFQLKSIFLLMLFCFIGVIGIFTLGVLGAGVWWLIVSCFLISTIYSLKAGVWSVLFATFIVTLAGYCFSNGIITLPVDANLYVKSPSSWISLIIATTIMPFIVFQAIASFQHATLSLLSQVDQQKSQIQKMATHDQLTGLLLPNQTNDKLQSAIEKAKISGKKVALFFIDLDGFKDVNDNYGHDAGDHILHEVAQRLLKHTNQSDTACRIGGDEFILIFPEIDDLEKVKIKAQDLIDEIAKPYKYLGKSIHIGTSIGISLFSDHAKNAKLLRILADKAMYSVKESGKNGYAFA
jgi:diguanylate cyclase (GGDEF)-like protein